MSRRIFNPRMLDYLMNHGEEHIIKEWVDIINDKFNESFTLKQMQHYFVRHHIPVKYECPKKRNHALAHPIGSERIKGDGMHQIKVGPHKWEYKQRYIYEQYYGVDLPDNVHVIFLDQNRDNFDIDNLMAVDAYNTAYMVSTGLFSKDKDATRTGVMVAELVKKTKNKLKEEQNGNKNMQHAKTKWQNNETKEKTILSNT